MKLLDTSVVIITITLSLNSFPAELAGRLCSCHSVVCRTRYDTMTEQGNDI